MPELPDVEVYREALAARVIGQPLRAVHVRNPFVLRTAVPPLDAVVGQTVRDVLRVGKRIVLAFDRELFLVLHLMIAGRLQWLPEGRKPPGKITLALFDFPTGTLAFTEAGTKRRASLHLAQGAAALAAFDAGGLDVMGANEPAFASACSRKPHAETRVDRSAAVQRDRQRLFGRNPHRARLSPLMLSQKLDDARSRACSRRRAKCSPSGPRDCAARPPANFRSA